MIVSLLFCSLLFSQSIVGVYAFDRNIDEIQEDLIPSTGVSFPIIWEGFLEKLVEEGVIEVTILDEKLSIVRGFGLTEIELSLFQYSLKTIHIDNKSQSFLLLVFGALGFSNNNTVLDAHNHMMENQTSPVGYAKYNSAKILNFTFGQQDLVEDIALNSYVPCCNNPVLVPNSNYGYANLGLIEFLVYNGISREEIFKTLLVFNSYWFPDQYLDVAVFVENQGQSWRQINFTEIMGYSYSSLEGYLTIKEFLVESNIYDPVSEEYIQTPFLQDNQLILILFITIFSVFTIILVRFLWKGWKTNKESVGIHKIE